MSASPFELKRKQLLYAGAVVVLGFILLGMLFWSLGGDLALENLDLSSSSKETTIATAGQRVNSQEVWVERMESAHKLTNEKLNAFEKLLLENIKAKARGEIQQPQSCPGWNPENDSSSLPSSNTVLSPSPSDRTRPDETRLDEIHFQENDSNGIPSDGSSSGVKKIMLKLSMPIVDPHNPGRAESGNTGSIGKSFHKSTLENTLPAGAFAKAILLGGVDASTSISSSSDPRPVLLRVTDQGNLPRKFKSDLKACHILASCYGDLSSERVYMRLEKLTCTERLTGEISETQVAGYVVGEDGRAGLRGIVVDKAGPLIRNSLVGGFFSGMSQYFGAQQQQPSFAIAPAGSASGASGGSLFGPSAVLMPQQMLTAGGFQGASNALEKYAEFFIKRAEQLQPVLQVAAGREVDVVFTQGTKFGETTVRQSLSKIRNRSRKQSLQQLENQGDNQSWLPLESVPLETRPLEGNSLESGPLESDTDNPQIGDE